MSKIVNRLKRLAEKKDYMVDLLGHLEHSYQTRKGYWKGGTVGVYGYGGGIIPRFTEIKDEAGEPKFKDAAEFHTLRVTPPPACTTTPTCCARCATSGNVTVPA